MSKILQQIRKRLGAQLNVLQALAVAYLVANGAAITDAIAAAVPDPYRPFAGVLAGFVSFAIVNAARESDRKRELEELRR